MFRLRANYIKQFIFIIGSPFQYRNVNITNNAQKFKKLDRSIHESIF